MKRLTKRAGGMVMIDDSQYSDIVKRAYEKLADYEDAEEQGLLLKLPCKVGDAVYVIDEYYNPPMIKKNDFSFILYQFWGKTVFLTKEEAEAALEEMKNANK